MSKVFKKNKFTEPHFDAIQYVGFWLAYTLPTVVFLLCPIVLLVGRNRYAQSLPTGSVLGTALRLFRYAARGKWSWNPVRTYKNLTQTGFWDNAKPSKQPVEKRPAWMTFDDVWVDEVKRGLKACAVFCFFPIWCKRLFLRKTILFVIEKHYTDVA